MKKAALSLFFLLSTHLLFAQWTTSGNNIYNSNTGYVGIGSTPGFTLSKLTVWDSVNLPASGGQSIGVLTVANKYAGIGSNMALFENVNPAANSQAAFYTPVQNVFGIQAQVYSTGVAGNLALNPLGGNVGIGITNAANKLEVVQTNTFTATNPTTYAITVAQDGADLGIGSYASGSVLQSFNSLPLFINPIGNNVIINGSSSNNVLIGETTQVNSAYRLDVNGGIRATGVTVNTTGADFVFDSAYQLTPLTGLGKYVKQYHHLPGIASASQMQREGMDLGETTTSLLQKVEELTLYSLAADQKVSEQQATLTQQQATLVQQQRLLEQLQAQLKAQQQAIEQLKQQVQGHK